MSEYLPSFIVEPVLRQARRFSRLSNSADESPSSPPTIPDLPRWHPSRLWNTSPPPSLEETEGDSEETTVQSITRTIQLWANQLNSLDQYPSPTLEAMDDSTHEASHPASGDEDSSSVFPPLETEPAQSVRPVLLEDQRTSSETSLNPAQELSYRSRVHEDNPRPHAVSDPVAAAPTESARSNLTDMVREEYTNTISRRRDGSGTLPEDDGMGPLRRKIRAIWDGPGTPAEKSRFVHELMMARYDANRNNRHVKTPWRPVEPTQRPGSPSSSSMMSGPSQEAMYNLTPEDLVPSYAPMDESVAEELDSSEESSKPQLGCVHYKRNVKMQCNICQKWYTCRLCHDEVESHTLPRRETKNMLCMLCNTPQPVGQFCKNCHVQAACYYCPVCKLWNNDPAKSIYHCDDCGICRLGEGLGKDFFHCKKCAACMSIQAESTHKCIERSTKCDCPICGEYLFTSNKPVAFMRCGHSIHEACFAEWCNTSYKCPICSKSIANMESQFRRLDRHIEEQPMPEEYRDNRAYIFCNDCNSRSVTKYHWLGLKCAICDSYNTTQLELLGADETPQLQQAQERAAQQADVSEAAITASQSRTPPDQMTQPVDIARAATAEVMPRSVDTTVDMMQSPTGSRSSWLLPRSPTTRSTRSLSPVVGNGNYIGTGQQRQPETPPAVMAAAQRLLRYGTRGLTSNDDDDDLDFWGRPNSPPRHQSVSQDDLVSELDSDSESESSHDDDAMDEEEDEEDEDVMDLFGHR
ncbi:putative RING finger protein C2F3.16 [Exophiala dermatitidis]